jgi:hypothetical protein
MEERQMNETKMQGCLKPGAESFVGALRDFLTPELFKQARKAAPRRKSPRWDLYPLVFILFSMNWCCSDSLQEKWEGARQFYVVTYPNRRRPGKTFAGFEKALAKLPMPVLRNVAAMIRGRIVALFGDRLVVNGFIPVGCDGTELECPRTEELEKRVGTFGKNGSSPMLWCTAIVHLASGIPWCWRWGRGGKASERGHLIFMLKWLPKLAIVVADAGYVGYDVASALIAAQVDFLIRMSSNATFYIDEEGQEASSFREGIVYYWPKCIRDQKKPPIRGRLLRVISPGSEHEVWLFTNIEDAGRLSLETAGLFYRWRWENEGFFRTFKQTMKKSKLLSRTVRLVHREAEAAMLATQLMLCQGALAMPRATEKSLPLRCSPRQVLLEIRKEIVVGVGGNLRPFRERVALATRDARERISPKSKRNWPRRKPHHPPHPPKILRLTADLKALLLNNLPITSDTKT